MSITLTTADEHLIVSALRYARGRGAYVVGRTARSVMEHWDDLTDNTRFLIARDLALDIRLRREESRSRTARYRREQPDWERLLDLIEQKPQGTPEANGLQNGGAW